MENVHKPSDSALYELFVKFVFRLRAALRLN
jgi:hypothetical protein